MTTDVLRVWEFDPDDDPAAATVAALDELVEPEFSAALLRSTGDTVTLQVVEGEPTRHADGYFYVERRGTFVLGRREEWPPASVGQPRRVLLVLRAWPSR
jgi:hypothetical protein